MIIEKLGNLLEAQDVDAIAHVCNLFCTFGAGFALHLKNKYPEAYAADCKTKNGATEKLGKCSHTTTAIKIYNMYAMTGLGRSKRQVHYEYLIQCLTAVKNNMIASKRKTLGIPYNMGCALAGGDWRIVRAIIESVFDESEVNVYIYKYEA
jgi:O-acetyl-ADP-ribose deacetylase (regulator of RNase III)